MVDEAKNYIQVHFQYATQFTSLTFELYKIRSDLSLSSYDLDHLQAKREQVIHQRLEHEAQLYRHLYKRDNIFSDSERGRCMEENWIKIAARHKILDTYSGKKEYEEKEKYLKQARDFTEYVENSYNLSKNAAMH